MFRDEMSSRDSHRRNRTPIGPIRHPVPDPIHRRGMQMRIIDTLRTLKPDRVDV
jgi:hypothetical protein